MNCLEASILSPPTFSISIFTYCPIKMFRACVTMRHVHYDHCNDSGTMMTIYHRRRLMIYKFNGYILSV